jgi:hypothetical protein
MISGIFGGAGIRDGGSIEGIPLLSEAYNLYFNNITHNEGYTLRRNSILDTGPLYVNPVAQDFSIPANSPAIDSGNNTFITDSLYLIYGTEDYLENPRPASTDIDIGAYEINGSNPANGNDSDVIINGTLNVTEFHKLKPLLTPPSCNITDDYTKIYFNNSTQKLMVCTDQGWQNLN